MFLCRNNKYAISTPTEDQYHSDGILPRALGYSMASLKVDGNDPLAVYTAVKHARKHIVEKKEPFFLEFMTYRLGDHSTSDNSNLYRPEGEKEVWAKKNNPILRFAAYLRKHNLKATTDEDDEILRKKIRQEVIDTLKKCGEYKKPKVSDLFTDVYDQLPANLLEQEAELE
jgi:2-oxoisovalerate dehydrogenase E1 component alpha subunit